MVDLHQLVGSGTESVYYHIVLVFFGMYFYLLVCHNFWVFFGVLEHNICDVCFFFYFLFSLSLVVLMWKYFCLAVVVSDTYSVSFLTKTSVLT